MLDSVWGRTIQKLNASGRLHDTRGSRRSSTGRKFHMEQLESRELLTASLAQISPVTVPQSLGYQVPLNGSASNTPQTNTVTSSNPDVPATVATGKFWTLNISHTSSGQPGDLSFSGPVTFQLFNDLTPTTATNIETFTTDGYYNGKNITRIAGNFSGKGNASDFVIQGGAPNADGTGSSGLPGTPFANEIVQQLAFQQPGTLAMANAGGTNSNDTQFFFTTGPQSELNQNYTIFGQVVSGQNIIDDLTQVATVTNSNLGGEKSKPVSPVIITSATLSNTNPNGVVHIDATGAVQGETSNIVVTATDPITHTTATQNFAVTVGPDTTTHSTAFTFKPLAFPVTQSVSAGVPATVQLNGTTQNPGIPAVKVSYSLATQPAHGTITGFDATTGKLVYTANAGFTGTDSFRYSVTNTGGKPSPLAGNTQTVTLTVTNAPPTPVTVNTGAVRLIGNTLVVSPQPNASKNTPNTIVVSEAVDSANSANNKVQVTINGQLDTNQPLISNLDRVVVYGAKGSENVTIDSSLDPSVAVTLNGGQGGKNTLVAGKGPTTLLGWYGRNTLVGGTGQNTMYGLAGRVSFKPTQASTTIFAGMPKVATKHHVPLTVPPEGTFYRYSNGHVVPVSSHTGSTTRKSTSTTSHAMTTQAKKK